MYLKNFIVLSLFIGISAEGSCFRNFKNNEFLKDIASIEYVNIEKPWEFGEQNIVSGAILIEKSCKSKDCPFEKGFNYGVVEIHSEPRSASSVVAYIYTKIVPEKDHVSATSESWIGLGEERQYSIGFSNEHICNVEILPIWERKNINGINWIRIPNFKDKKPYWLNSDSRGKTFNPVSSIENLNIYGDKFFKLREPPIFLFNIAGEKINLKKLNINEPIFFITRIDSKKVFLKILKKSDDCCPIELGKRKVENPNKTDQIFQMNFADFFLSSGELNLLPLDGDSYFGCETFY